MLAPGMKPWAGPAGVQSSRGTAYPQKGPGLLLPSAVAILKLLIMDQGALCLPRADGGVRKMVPRVPQRDPKGPEHQEIRHIGAMQTLGPELS